MIFSREIEDSWTYSSKFAARKWRTAGPCGQLLVTMHPRSVRPKRRLGAVLASLRIFHRDAGPRAEEWALPAYARDMEHMNPQLARYLLYHPVVFLKGERVVKYLREYSHTQWLAPNELRPYQLRKLQGLLKFAATRVPYYRDSFKGIDLSTIADLNDVAQLPCVDKATIRDRAMSLRSKRPDLFTSVKTTGGSTGQPVSILKSPSSLAMERAATWRSYAWAGISIGDPQARFWEGTTRDSNHSGQCTSTVTSRCW